MEALILMRINKTILMLHNNKGLSNQTEFYLLCCSLIARCIIFLVEGSRLLMDQLNQQIDYLLKCT